MVDQKLVTLITLAKEQNYTNTAKILSMTQPAVSQHIKALEDEYNIKIFEKSGRNLIPTIQGDILIKNAKRMIRLEELTKRELDEAKGKPTSVDIGISLNASDYLIPTIFGICAKKYPNLSVNFHTDLAESMLERLKTFEFDFIIVEGNLNYEGFDEDDIATDRFVAVASPLNPLAKKHNITMNDLKTEKLILRHQKANTRILFESFLNTHFDSIANYNVILEIENPSLIKELVMKNYGISIIPYSACKVEIGEKKLVELDVPELDITRKISIVSPQKTNFSELINDIKGIQI